MGNPPDVQAEQLKGADGQFMVKFPSEPNVWIHTGHTKALYLDFLVWLLQKMGTADEVR